MPILHRYFDTTGGIATLEQQRMKVAEPKNFNDPFEFLFRYLEENTTEALKKKEEEMLRSDAVREAFKTVVPVLTDELYEELIQKSLDSMTEEDLADRLEGLQGLDLRSQQDTFEDDNIRVLCATGDVADPYQEILMWAHYAYSHQGFRIHINDAWLKKNATDFRKVEYSHEKPLFDYPGNIDDQFKIFFTKSKAWEYENEYRMVIVKERCIEEKNKGKLWHFVPIDPLYIKRVDIGIKCSDEDRLKVQELLSADCYNHVELKQAKIHPLEYMVEYVDIEGTTK